MLPSADTTETIADEDAGSFRDRLRPGSQIGRYVVVETLGMGAMGMVFAAYDPKLDRRVALKLLRSENSVSNESIGRSRLFREAQALAKLSHANVIQVHDVDTFEDQVFISMEYIEGQSLKKWLGMEKRSVQEIVRVFIDAARGLAAAHAADVIHRDFKPENVLIGDDGRVCVADFGLATPGQSRDSGVFETFGSGDSHSTDELVSEIMAVTDSRLTKAGRVVGTPAYMSPEQFLGLPVGPYTDQFAFCVALFEALTGKLPFEGKTRSANLNARVEGRIRTDVVDGIPKWLDRIVRRGLMPHAKQRYPDMEALIADLRRDPGRKRRRWIGVAVLSGAMLVGGASVGAFVGAPTQACELPSSLESAWDEGKKTEIHEAFEETGLPYATDTWTHVESGLDGYAGRWADAWTEACEATHQQRTSTVATLGQRRRCLDGQLEELRMSTELLVGADKDVVDHALAILDGLPEPSECLDVSRASLLAQRKVGPKFDAMQSDLSAAKVRFRAGKYGQSKALAERVVTSATALEDPLTRAEGLRWSSESKRELGEFADAEAELRSLLELSTEYELGRLETYAWTKMASMASNVHKHPARAEALLLSAKMSAKRAGKPRAAMVALMSTEAMILLDQDRLEEAVAKFDELETYRLETSTRETEERDARAALRARATLAVALAKGRDGERAVLEFREAIEEGTRQFGANHPQLAGWHGNLANTLITLDRHSEARPSAEEALRIRELNFGSKHPDIAKQLVALGAIARSEERYGDAFSYYERALASIIEAHGNDHPFVAVVTNNIGQVLRKQGKPEEALEHHMRAREIFAARYDPVHTRLANTDKHLCSAHLDLGNFVEAERACLRALDVHEQLQGPSSTKVRGDIKELEQVMGQVGPAARERIRVRIEATRERARTPRPDETRGASGEDKLAPGASPEPGEQR